MRVCEQSAEQVRVMEAELETIRKREQDASLEERTLIERLGNTEREMTRTGKWLRDLSTQMASKAKDLDEAGDELNRLSTRREAVNEALAGFADRLAEAESEAAREKVRLDEWRAQLNTQENDARKARRERAEIGDRIGKLELDLQEIGFQKQALHGRLETEYRQDTTAWSEHDWPGLSPDQDPGGRPNKTG